MPTFKNAETTVKRRFSDFLGLHERLNSKFLHLGRIVPPAPEKSVVGKYMNVQLHMSKVWDIQCGIELLLFMQIEKYYFGTEIIICVELYVYF